MSAHSPEANNPQDQAQNPQLRAAIGNILRPGVKAATTLITEVPDVAERIGKAVMSRRGFGVMIGVETGALIVSEVVDVPKLFNELLFRAEFNDVWDELQSFLNPPTDKQLREMVYNPNGILTYTPDQLQNLLIVGSGDSMNLAFGVRHNSLGPNQPNSWLKRHADNLQAGAKAAGIDAKIATANYAQPGAAEGLVRYQFPEGNVQLGAKTIQDMAADHQGEMPPVQTMIDFEGQVDATIGMNGDHLREALDKFLNYMHTDVEFQSFCMNASEDKLTGHVKDVLKDVLHTYKRNIDQFKADFKQALDIYAKVNKIRTSSVPPKPPIRLICTLPINYKYAKAVPHQPLADDSKRQSGGYLSLAQYPNAPSAAQRMTSSYYEAINPLIEAFHNDTGIEVYTVPMLDLSKDQALFAKDGHFTDKGEVVVGDQTSSKSQIIDNYGNSLVTFNEHGIYQLAA